jgi:3-deoxy-D-manno-octulosonic-acid transferase
MGPAYRAAARVLHRLPYPRGTLAASLAGRRAALARWRAWAADARGDGPLIWAHAASVGESLVLQPVVARLRAGSRHLRVVLTHTSPSVAAHTPLRDFARTDYLPLDEPGPMAAVLDALRPALLLFSRGDLWPELVAGAAARGIPVAVAGGMVGPRSARLRVPAVWALRPMHRLVGWVGAASDGDADRWRRLGVPPDRVTVTGDPRHDQVADRLPDLRLAARWRSGPRGAALTMVAGSIEAADDGLLAEAARRAGAAWRWLVVPHDPGPRRVEQVEAAFRRRGVAAARWDAESPPPAAEVAVVARQGLLADLYWAADAAYVGGGFRPGGLHAVCEPAVVALPIAAGPFLSTVRDGALLERAGGIGPVADADTLVSRLDAWAASPTRRWHDGLAARGALEAGAARRTVEALGRLAGARDDPA